MKSLKIFKYNKISLTKHWISWNVFTVKKLKLIICCRSILYMHTVSLHSFEWTGASREVQSKVWNVPEGSAGHLSPATKLFISYFSVCARRRFVITVWCSRGKMSVFINTFVLNVLIKQTVSHPRSLKGKCLLIMAALETLSIPKRHFPFQP